MSSIFCSTKRAANLLAAILGGSSPRMTASRLTASSNASCRSERSKGRRSDLEFALCSPARRAKTPAENCQAAVSHAGRIARKEARRRCAESATVRKERGHPWFGQSSADSLRARTCREEKPPLFRANHPRFLAQDDIEEPDPLPSIRAPQ